MIWHIFDDVEIRRNHHCFVVDIYATKNLAEFVNMLGKAVVDELRPKGKRAWEKFINLLYERFEAVTSYMHRILNVLFSRTEKGATCTPPMVDEAIDFLIHMSSDTYESLFYQMPEKQRLLFLAIARDGKAHEINGGQFLKRHKLSSASSVSSALKGLLEKDFVTVDKGVYSVYDQFFPLWLKFKGLI